MSQNQPLPEEKINAQVNSNQPAGRPNSAYSTPIVEKYVRKRSEKADRQSQDEQNGTSPSTQNKSTWKDWRALKYVIL